MISSCPKLKSNLNEENSKSQEERIRQSYDKRRLRHGILEIETWPQKVCSGAEGILGEIVNNELSSFFYRLVYLKNNTHKNKSPSYIQKD